MKRVVVMTLICIFTGLLSTSALAQHDQHAGSPPDDIGAAHVKFENSCAAAVKPDFNKGVALLHSFWFRQAAAMFDSILTRDANCSMAYWGKALASWGNPFGVVQNQRVVEMTKLLIDNAKAIGSPTSRERGFIDAVAQLTTDFTAGTHPARIVAYAAAMAKVVQDNPSDTEAKMFYALAINQMAAPTDKTYAKQLQAAAILEPLFQQMPEHPGLAHYIIHAYDAPPLAERALVAARRYASIAPAAPHALHMPSHTFTRVGLWKESIESNRRSAEAWRKDKGAGEELHALDYQTYAYLQLGQDKAAKTIVDRSISILAGEQGAVVGTTGVGAYAVNAIPARYALERDAWAEAAQLTPRPGTVPFAAAISYFARALGAARSGNPNAATADISKLADLRDEMKALQDDYWTEIVDIQRRIAVAWVAYARGKKDEGLAAMSAVADAEDATEKSAISPGPLAPARELYGFMLLEANKPKEALVAFEATMKKEPHRFRSTYGGAKAAQLAGDKAKAATYYKQLMDLAKEADSERPEIIDARKNARR